MYNTVVRRHIERYRLKLFPKMFPRFAIVVSCTLNGSSYGKTITTNQQLNSVFSEYDFFLRLLIIFIHIKKRLLTTARGVLLQCESFRGI